MKYENDIVKIYLTTNHSVSQIVIDSLGCYFTNNTYPNVTSIYGDPSGVNRDGKISIVLLEIKNKLSSEQGYIGGYFSAYDLFQQESLDRTVSLLGVRSNEREVLYVDCVRRNIGTLSGGYSTVTHERQYLIVYNSRIYSQVSKHVISDAWINEGLAMSIEYKAYGQKGISTRFQMLESTHYNKETSLIYWNIGTLLSNYALSAAYFNFITNQVSEKKASLKMVNDSPESSLVGIGKSLGDKYTGTTGLEKFNQSFYDFSLGGLYNVEKGVLPKLVKSNALSRTDISTFAGIGEVTSGAKEYNVHSYTPMFLRYSVGAVLQVANATIADISLNGDFSEKNKSLSSVKPYNSKNYGIVFLSPFVPIVEKVKVTLSNRTIENRSKRKVF